MSGEKALDWFETKEDFLRLCGDAQSQAHSEWDQEFSADMIIKAKRYGLDCFMSPKQLKHLCRIADWEEPARLGGGVSPSRRSPAPRTGEPPEGSTYYDDGASNGRYDDDIPF